jgi:hypothetical protein
LESGAGDTHSWNSAFALRLIIFGIVLVGLFLFYEARYAGYPLVPIHIFKNLSNVASLGTGFCHSFVFIAYDYFLPLYFQVVLGFSPILSGLCIFSLVLPLSAVTTGTGFFVARTGNYRYAIWFGLVIMTIGTGLFISFDSRTVWWKIIVFQIIAAPRTNCRSHLGETSVDSFPAFDKYILCRPANTWRALCDASLNIASEMGNDPISVFRGTTCLAWTKEEAGARSRHL